MVRMMIRMIVRHLILSTGHYQISPSHCGHLILPFDIICPFAIVDFWYPHAIGDIWYFLVIIICPRRLKRGWAPIGGTFDIFQAMSFVPETMVWFGAGLKSQLERCHNFVDFPPVIRHLSRDQTRLSWHLSRDQTRPSWHRKMSYYGWDIPKMMTSLEYRYQTTKVM